MANGWSKDSVYKLIKAAKTYERCWTWIHMFENFPQVDAPDALRSAYNRYYTASTEFTDKSKIANAKLEADDPKKASEIAGRMTSYLKTNPLSRIQVPEYFQDFIEEHAVEYIEGLKRQPITPNEFDRRALETKIHELAKRKTLWEVIGDRVIDAVKELPPIPAPEKPKVRLSKLDEEEWILVISDVQLGSTVSKEETGGLGYFNTETVYEQLDNLKDALESIKAYHTNPPKILRIFFLGDIIDGSTIFLGQQRAIDQTAVKQVILSVDLFSEFLNWCSGMFPRVKAYGVVGNHGRIGRKGEAAVMDNLDYLAYRWMQERAESNNRVTIEPAESWWQLVEVLGWRFLLAHGDDVRAWMGLPFYGATRYAARWREIFSNASAGSHPSQPIENIPTCDFVVMAHHHQPAQFGPIIMNGAWPGGSEFSLKVMVAGGDPSQKLFAVHKEYGVTWSRNIMLRKIGNQDIKIYK